MTKYKKRLTQKQRQKLSRLGLLLLAAIVGLIIGLIIAAARQSQSPPQNLIWAADNTVKIPKDLPAFLNRQNDCKNYRGTGTPTGVGLWGVYQVAHGRFAKIAYGCSWNLNPYIMAVKQNDAWQLIQPAEYFAPFNEDTDPRQGALPKCSVLEKYKIPKDIESFCVAADGTAKSNEL